MNIIKNKLYEQFLGDSKEETIILIQHCQSEHHIREEDIEWRELQSCNSGSGKTTTGKALQRKFGHGTMLISQDVVRREMLFVKDGPNTEASQLLLELALYGKSLRTFFPL